MHLNKLQKIFHFPGEPHYVSYTKICGHEVPRLQNSPYFCVFKDVRIVKQKVWNEAENRERDWGPTGVWGSRTSRAQDSYATFYRFL